MCAKICQVIQNRYLKSRSCTFCQHKPKRARTFPKPSSTIQTLSSSGGFLERSLACILPWSNFSTMRWHVTPVSASPSKIAQKPDQHPRCLGSRDGWKLMLRQGSVQRVFGCGGPQGFKRDSSDLSWRISEEWEEVPGCHTMECARL